MERNRQPLKRPDVINIRLPELKLAKQVTSISKQNSDMKGSSFGAKAASAIKPKMSRRISIPIGYRRDSRLDMSPTSGSPKHDESTQARNELEKLLL